MCYMSKVVLLFIILYSQHFFHSSFIHFKVYRIKEKFTCINNPPVHKNYNPESEAGISDSKIIISQINIVFNNEESNRTNNCKQSNNNKKKSIYTF